MNTDFSKITPCVGCRENGGKCVKMWENECRIFKCCEEHDAFFCGLCRDFPCEYIKSKVAEWDKNGVYKLKELAEEFYSQQK